MGAEVLIELENVGLSYRRGGVLPWRQSQYWALRDVSFQLRRGETLGVIGRNGAGKSSLLKILAGILEPDRGRIQRSGARCALLTFGAGFQPRLSGRQNIVLSGLLLGMSRSEVKQRLGAIVELADLGEFVDQPVHTYSSGMKARLGFSIAYHVRTDVLLIDEALATGDEAFRREATERIKARIRSDLSVVMVSHSMALVGELCDRVVQIEDGRTLPALDVARTIERYRTTARRPSAAGAAD